LHEDQYTILIYLAKLFVEWEMFQINFAEIKAHILYSVTLYKIVPFMR